jgi:hypothetical protein
VVIGFSCGYLRKRNTPGDAGLIRAIWGSYLLMLQFGGLPQWWPPSHALQ